MKRLYLLRHAEAESPGTGSDRERSLARQGYHDAESLGRMMRLCRYVPDFTFCSGARRTRETCQIVREFLPRHGLSYSDTLYNAPSDTLLDTLRAADDRHGALLLIAHNPGIYLLARALEDGGDTALSHRLREGYSSGTLAVFDCPCESWGNLTPGRNMLRRIASPVDYRDGVSDSTQESSPRSFGATAGVSSV